MGMKSSRFCVSFCRISLNDAENVKHSTPHFLSQAKFNKNPALDGVVNEFQSIPETNEIN
jgi:hypothetical protein